MSINVGVVGFGKMGMLHGALANSMDGMTLVAVTEKSRLVRMASKRIMKNVKQYSDYRKMIDKNNLDAIIVTTPTFNHLEVALHGAQKGISLFIEKPLSRKAQEAEMLQQIVNSQKVISMVGFNYRFLPSVLKGKELLPSIGDIKIVKAYFKSGDILSEHEGWRFNPEISGGGVLIDFGIHLVDILSWFFGDVKSVNASQEMIHSESVEDEVTSKIIFKNGILADFETSWSCPQFRKPSLKIQIDAGDRALVITEQTVEIIEGEKATIITEPDLYKGSYVDIGGIAYSLQMEAFYNSIISQEDSASNIANACCVHKIVDAMYQSAACKQEVQL